ncbi:mechanosensitive ion channel family protein [Synechococcus sp. BIOS-U3-1]|uniref:mechanosensitive ion channel family protein n=1 Tax=Synechococcus sp. BIOS-U3-1 TaxID=1400865 RepID=UPI00351C3EA6|tara:strand:- start:40 stop:1422 length:1383 start_codon:yes stop_codon:yes gene_type:complete
MMSTFSNPLITVAPGDILVEMLSWLSFVERWPVLIQLILVLIVLLIARTRSILLRRNRHLQRLLNRAGLHQRFPDSIRVLLGPALLLLLAGVFAVVQVPYGLLRYFGLLWLGWNLFTPLKVLVEKTNPRFPIGEVETTLFKPIYVFTATLSLLSLLGSQENLARIGIANLFEVEITLGKLYTAIVAIYLIVTIASRPAALMAWMSGVIFGVQKRNQRGLELLFRYSVIGIGIIGVAYYIGINGNAFIAIAGGLSVGIGFGTKEIISNFISSIWLLFEGSVRPGEILMINGDPCTVRKLGLRATQLKRGRDGAELLIPNQNFFTQEAASYTATETSRRDSVVVGAAYRHDPDKIIDILLEIAADHSKVKKYPPAAAFVTEFAESSINYKMLFWVANPLDAFNVGSDLRRAIWKRFEKENISIPFPQRQIYSMEWPPKTQQSLRPQLQAEQSIDHEPSDGVS